MDYVIAFDFSLKSTGIVVMPRDGSFIPREEIAIKTDWAGGQWWAPQRYMAFFRDLDIFMSQIQTACEGSRIDLAAEAVIWDKESTPALFALHTRFWEWAWRWRTRMVYLTYQRWRNLVLEKHGISRTAADIEGKAAVFNVMAKEVGHRPKCHDISDAWGVGCAAVRLYDYVDGHVSFDELSVKEKKFFDTTRKVKGVPTPSGIVNEHNTNYFDWRERENG